MDSKGFLLFFITASLIIISYERETIGSFCPSHRIRHPTKCNLFFYCINITLPQTSHVWIPGKCLMGLVFEPILGMCVIPGEEADCLDQSGIRINLETEDNVPNILKTLMPEEPNLDYEMPLQPNDDYRTQLQTPYALRNSLYNGYSADSKLLNKKDQNLYQSERPFVSGKWDFTGKEKQQSSPTRSNLWNLGEYKPMGLNQEGFQSGSSKMPMYGHDNRNDNDPAFSEHANDDASYYTSAIMKSKLGDSLAPINTENPNNNYKDTQNSKYSSEHIHKSNDAKNSNDALPIHQRDTQNDTASKEQQSGSSQKIMSKQSEISCKNRARQPHISDCTKYYTCNPQSELIAYNCPSHTSFNPYTQKCDTLSYEDCLKQMNSFNSGATENTINDDIEEVTSDYIKDNQQSDTIQESFQCMAEGKFEDTSSMQHYYICSLNAETQELTQYRISCPTELYYCPLRKICTNMEKCKEENK